MFGSTNNPRSNITNTLTTGALFGTNPNYEFTHNIDSSYTLFNRTEWLSYNKANDCSQKQFLKESEGLI